MNRDDYLFSFMPGILGFFFGAIVGPLSGPLIALLVFMAIDYVTGLMYAWKMRKLSSRKGFLGLMKKMLILFLVILGNMLDSYVLGDGTSAFRTMVIFFFLCNEGISILENAGKIGVPIPEKLQKSIELLKNDI